MLILYVFFNANTKYFIKRRAWKKPHHILPGQHHQQPATATNALDVVLL